MYKAWHFVDLGEWWVYVDFPPQTDLTWRFSHVWEGWGVPAYAGKWVVYWAEGCQYLYHLEMHHIKCNNMHRFFAMFLVCVESWKERSPEFSLEQTYRNIYRLIFGNERSIGLVVLSRKDEVVHCYVRLSKGISGTLPQLIKIGKPHQWNCSTAWDTAGSSQWMDAINHFLGLKVLGPGVMRISGATSARAHDGVGKNYIGKVI